MYITLTKAKSKSYQLPIQLSINHDYGGKAEIG